MKNKGKGSNPKKQRGKEEKKGNKDLIKSHKNTKKQTKQKREEGIRIPRIMGLTLKAREGTKTKRELQNEILRSWISSDLSLYGEIRKPEEIAEYLGLSSKYVFEYMWKYMEKMGKYVKPENLESITRGLQFQAIKKILESDFLIRKQANILLASQGSEYKPFLSSAVNQILSTLSQHSARIPNFLQSLLSKMNTQNLPENDPNGSHPMTVSLALELINKSAKSDQGLEGPSEVKSLPPSTSDLSIPNLNPNTQNLTKILKPKLNPTTLPIDPNPSIPITHENRREIQEDILDEDEFIA